MFYLHSFTTLLSVLVTLSRAQNNITVNSTSPSIQYGGNARDALLCKIDPSTGNVLGGQPACYNAPSQCTEGAYVGQGGTGEASFTFKGSAIYINSLLNFFSPIYTVTLDGKPIDVDGVRPSGAFVCSPLFSQTGLEPNVEHQIRLSVKGPSPTRNQTFPNSEKSFVFSLISFVYTETAGNGNTSTSTNPTPTNTSDTSSATTSAPSGAEVPQLSGLLALFGLAAGLFASTL